MKSSKFLFLVVFVLLTLTISSYSQQRVILSVYMGGGFPTADFGGIAEVIPDSTYYIEKNYGMKFGFNLINAEIKYAFDKKCHVRGAAGLSVNKFINPSAIFTFGFDRPLRENFGIVSTYLGAEYAFLPGKE